jgi:hypothetical protein
VVGSPLHGVVDLSQSCFAVKAGWILGPFFFWTRGIWGNILCDDWSRYHETNSMEV